MRLFTLIKIFLRQFKRKNLPDRQPAPDLSETRQENTALFRQVKLAKAGNLTDSLDELSARSSVGHCPYCSGKDFIKSGKRKKKYETQQRYFCNSCQRFFVPQNVKGKSFPLKLILEGLSYYNKGFSMVEACAYLKENFGLEVKDSTLSDWVKEFTPICRYSRLRPYGLKLFSPNQVIQSVHLFHRQVYDFSLHRAKLALLLQEYRNNKFDNLREFLEAIQKECPHQFFQQGARSSELKVDFDLREVMIKEKQNFATRIATLALQAVNDNKERHKALQKFMLCNDSVTVAVEVPVYMDKMDIEHMQEELGFKIPIADIASRPLEEDGAGVGIESGPGKQLRHRENSTSAATSARIITGHIDILQLRNGAVHILDYKPNAAAGKQSASITQLTLYALMLSRLTGLRLFDFKCAWFDENAYFEFFPLHVVYKLRQYAKKDHPDQMKLFAEGSQDVI
ncbi:MAG: hypothetical protein WC628_04410 [Candidatus Omnitrophota bacterium]